MAKFCDLFFSIHPDNSLTHLLDHQGSFNIYMFHGGTNFGFTGGALNMSGYSPMTTSYGESASRIIDSGTQDRLRYALQICSRLFGWVSKCPRQQVGYIVEGSQD